jgi:hypothetical protein
MIPGGDMTDTRYVHVPSNLGFIMRNTFYSNLRNMWYIQVLRSSLF